MTKNKNKASRDIVIKRYQNRKLYDTGASRYVTLEDIGEMLKEGHEVRIVDNRTKKDLTNVTLAQILFEEEKRNRSSLPIASLKQMLRRPGEQIAELVSGAAGSMGRSLDEVQSSINARITWLKEGVGLARELQKELTQLESRIDALEKRIQGLG